MESSGGSLHDDMPRIIMQTWKTEKLPPQWQASQDAIKQLMPHWRYVLLTDDDNLAFVKTHFPDFVKTFTSFEYDIQRADAIRYMWLYVNGGVYLDLDIQPLKAFDTLFGANSKTRRPDLYVVKSSIMNNIYTNAFMAAKPGLTVMLKCLEFMQAGNSWWHCGKHLKVINLTGPNMFTRAIQFVKAEEDSLKRFTVSEIPTKLIIPCSICDVDKCKVTDAYCKSLGGSSWSGADTKFLALLHCNRQAIVVLFIVVFIIIVVIKRRSRKHP